MSSVPLSIAQFGQIIKAKHPEYSDMHDADVGSKVLSKYPQYQDMVSQDPAAANRPSVPAAPLPAGLQGPPVAPASDNALQRNVDVSLAQSPQDGALASGVKSMARVVASPFVHPQQAATGLISGINPMQYAPGGDGFQINTAPSPGSQLYGATKQDFKQNGIAKGSADVAGQVAGGLLLGGMTGAAVKGAIPPIVEAGNGLQNLGAWNMTRILDQGTTAAVRDARTGVNPGESMLKSGIGTSISKGSLANKIARAKEATGAMIGNAVDRADQNVLAPPITPDQTYSAIRNPINRAIGRVTGPGGTASTLPYEDLGQSMTRTAPGATNPIYGPNAPPKILPSDLWKTIRNVDANTKFNTDPEVESVNEARRDIRGNLRPLLEQTDPTIKPLSHNYAGLNSAGDAMERTSSRSAVGINPSIVHNLSTNTPFNTAISSGLYRAGGALVRAGGATEGSIFPGFAARQANPFRSPNLLESSTVGNPGGEDFTQGGYATRPPVVTAAPKGSLYLPESSSAGEAQPMVSIKAPAAYPQLAQEFARTRITPNKFNGPTDNPFSIPKGLLPSRASRAKYGR